MRSRSQRHPPLTLNTSDYCSPDGVLNAKHYFSPVYRGEKCFYKLISSTIRPLEIKHICVYKTIGLYKMSGFSVNNEDVNQQYQKLHKLGFHKFTKNGLLINVQHKCTWLHVSCCLKYKGCAVMKAY